MNYRYKNKRVLITCADRYMGNPVASAFEKAGAEVFTDDDPLLNREAVDLLLKRAGSIDILIANFAEDPLPNELANIEDQDLNTLYNSIVFPFIRTISAVGPMMKTQGYGKIIAITSASSLRGIPGYSAYCSARGAQNAFVRAVGLELAAHNVQINAIAQNFVKNERYFPDEFIESDYFKEVFLPTLPTQKVAESEETAELALFLASEKCTHMVGQIIPWAGGWVTTTG